MKSVAINTRCLPHVLLQLIKVVDGYVALVTMGKQCVMSWDEIMQTLAVNPFEGTRPTGVSSMT